MKARKKDRRIFNKTAKLTRRVNVVSNTSRGGRCQ